MSPPKAMMSSRTKEGREPDARISIHLAEAIVVAAVKVGSDGRGKGGLVGYLQMLAQRYPKNFARLLPKIPQFEWNAEASPPRMMTLDIDKFFKLSPEDRESPEKIQSCLVDVEPEDTVN
jgi:hypothetical protein